MQLKKKRQLSHGHLRLLWELSEQGYEVSFEPKDEGVGERSEHTNGTITCIIKQGDRETLAESNNVSSALYLAYRKLRLQ